MHRNMGISKFGRSYRKDSHFSYQKATHFWHSETSFLLSTVLQKKWCVEGGDESGVILWTDKPSFVPQDVPTFCGSYRNEGHNHSETKIKRCILNLLWELFISRLFCAQYTWCYFARCIEHKTAGTHTLRRVKLSLINLLFICNKSGGTHSERNIIFTIQNWWSYKKVSFQMCHLDM